MGNEEFKFVDDKLFVYAPLPQYYPEEEYEQEPKTGYWIEHLDNSGNLHHLECSKCHNWHRDYNKDKYCPNCGEKMESEGKE